MNIYTWSENGKEVVVETKMPTFEIRFLHGDAGDENQECMYFSQDEQAGIDQDEFARIGFAYVEQIVWGEGPTSPYVANYNGYETLASFR